MILNNLIIATALAIASRVVPVGARQPPLPRDLGNAGPPNDASDITWTVVSAKPGSTINDKMVKLRPLFHPPSGGLVVVDDKSPVLTTSLRGGSLYSVMRDEAGKLHDLGPTGYLNLSSELPGRINKFDFRFANVTGLPNTGDLPTSVDSKWRFIFASHANITAQLLDHDFNSGVRGFSACPGDRLEGGGDWYKLYFMVSYSGEQWNQPECENVSLKVTVRPKNE
ncbi:hypothetical protein F5Y11DRAFT_363414 [Daldinia sp. FL1419]|nr:hypothetical protein F5Y11DRAFT_363414 [Daldinia sp. FL1419]